MKDRELPLDAIVLSAGLSVPGGHFVDAKLDICCCPRCVKLDAAQAASLIDRLSSRLGVATPAIDEVLAAGELAFLGVGLDRKLEPRLNVYLKPQHLN
jgi:hypothetical protein